MLNNSGRENESYDRLLNIVETEFVGFYQVEKADEENNQNITSVYYVIEWKVSYATQ